MVLQCCACRETRVEGCTVTFHRFPTDEKRRKLWIKNIGKGEDWFPNKNTKLCSRHFTEDSFDRLKTNGTWLKPTAVPTIFEGTPKRQYNRRQIPVTQSGDNKEAKINGNNEHISVQPVIGKKPEQTVQLLEEEIKAENMIKIRKPEEMIQLSTAVMKPAENKNNFVNVKQLRIIKPEILFVNDTGMKPTCTTESVPRKTIPQQKKIVLGTETQGTVNPRMIMVLPGRQSSLNQAVQSNGLKFQPVSNVVPVEQQQSSTQAPPNIKVEPHEEVECVSQTTTVQQQKILIGQKTKQIANQQMLMIIPQGCQTIFDQTEQTKGLICQPTPNLIFVEPQISSTSNPLNIKIEPTDQADTPMTSNVTENCTNPTISYVLQPSQSSTESASEIKRSNSTVKPYKNKRLKYLGDFTPESLQCPSNARKYIALVNEEIERKNNSIHILRVKSKRLKRKLDDMTNTCIDLKKKLLLGYTESS